MSRRKKTRSIHIHKAQTRLASVVTINSQINWMAGIIVRIYKGLMTRTQQALVDYNLRLVAEAQSIQSHSLGSLRLSGKALNYFMLIPKSAG